MVVVVVVVVVVEVVVVVVVTVVVVAVVVAVVAVVVVVVLVVVEVVVVVVVGSSSSGSSSSSYECTPCDRSVLWTERSLLERRLAQARARENKSAWFPGNSGGGCNGICLNDVLQSTFTCSVRVRIVLYAYTQQFATGEEGAFRPP